MKAINAQEFAQKVYEETGLELFPEDRVYGLRPLSWFLKTPWWGLKKLYYTEDAFDCDDFVDWLKLHLSQRNAKEFAVGFGAGALSGLSLPIFRCKVELNGTTHWILGIVSEEEVSYIERTAETIRKVPRHHIEKFWRVYP